MKVPSPAEPKSNKVETMGPYQPHACQEEPEALTVVFDSDRFACRNEGVGGIISLLQRNGELTKKSVGGGMRQREDLRDLP